MKILYVEDEPQIAKPIIKALGRRNFVVEWFDDGKIGLNQALIETFDLIILDLNLPNIDGIEIAKSIRNKKIETPILMLTARSDQENVLEGFQFGADDYLTKPFNLKELLYRINSLIKRSSSNKTDDLHHKNIKLNRLSTKVFLDDDEINLNKKEFGILEYLLRNKGKVVSQEEILNHVWESDIDSLTQTVRTNIKTLRKKIDPEKKIIKTLKGRGYIVEKL